MCFPVKDKSEKQQKFPLLLVRYKLFPCHIYHGQRPHFSIIRSQVEHFSGFGKTQRSYSEVQSLRCVLPLLPVLHSCSIPLPQGTVGSETAQSKGKEYEIFSMGSHSFFHSSPLQYKLETPEILAVTLHMWVFTGETGFEWCCYIFTCIENPFSLLKLYMQPQDKKMFLLYLLS